MSFLRVDHMGTTPLKMNLEPNNHQIERKIIFQTRLHIDFLEGIQNSGTLNHAVQPLVRGTGTWKFMRLGGCGSGKMSQGKDGVHFQMPLGDKTWIEVACGGSDEDDVSKFKSGTMYMMSKELSKSLTCGQWLASRWSRRQMAAKGMAFPWLMSLIGALYRRTKMSPIGHQATFAATWHWTWRRSSSCQVSIGSGGSNGTPSMASWRPRSRSWCWRSAWLEAHIIYLFLKTGFFSCSCLMVHVGFAEAPSLSVSICAIGSINSHYSHILGDGHQPNSRSLHTHYKDSGFLWKVGWVYPQDRELINPGTYVLDVYPHFLQGSLNAIHVAVIFF